MELGGPTSARGGCESQHLWQRLHLLQLKLQVATQDDVIDGVLVSVVTLVHHKQCEGWGHMGRAVNDASPALLPASLAPTASSLHRTSS